MAFPRTITRKKVVGIEEAAWLGLDGLGSRLVAFPGTITGSELLNVEKVATGDQLEVVVVTSVGW